MSIGRGRINKSSNKNPNMKERNERAYLSGIYVAEIISNLDITRTGRVQVFIAALTLDQEGTKGFFDAIWTSPFAGSTNPRAVGKEIEDPDQSMSSYGWWGQVPDIGNLVLVAFGDGNTKFPFVISCLFPPMFANMVPGIPAGKNYQAPSKLLPTVEKNKRTQEIKHNDTFRPIQHTLSEAIVKQGLIGDATRGAGNSGSRRESPSEVFGILTPGPRKSEITGVEDDYDIRLGGHQFVMDDNLDSRQIRIRSAEGNQVLLDDNEGIIYLINKSGRAWVEMNSLGDIHIFGEGSINMRAKQNFNLRADHNINIEAGQNINLKAAQDTTGFEYKGVGAGTGGDIWLDAQGEIKNIAGASILSKSSAGDVSTVASGSVKLEASANDVEIKAAREFKSESGQKYSIKSGGGDVAIEGQRVVEKGSEILMNSGGPDPTAPGNNEARELGEMVSLDHEDYTNKQPEYDKEGENLLPTDGKRERLKIKSIVPNLITAEPYTGHSPSNPENENENSIVPDESIADAMPLNSNGVAGPLGDTPADVNAPGGFQQSKGWDDGGNPIMDPPDDKGPTSNFSPAITKKIEETQALGTAVAAVSAGVKPLQAPTMTPGNYKVIGSGRKISDLEAKTKQIAFTANKERTQPNDAQLGDLVKGIALVQAAEKTGADTRPLLAKYGIHISRNGPNKVYTSSDGIIVDTGGGVGAVANNLMTASDLVRTSNVVSQYVGNTQLSDNQMASLVLMADHVGVDKFQNSRTLQLVKAHEYSKVPNSMLDFNKGTIGYSRRPTTRQDYIERGQMYGELFQTPDSVDLPTFESGSSWGAMAKAIKFARYGQV